MFTLVFALSAPLSFVATVLSTLVASLDITTFTVYAPFTKRGKASSGRYVEPSEPFCSESDAILEPSPEPCPSFWVVQAAREEDIIINVNINAMPRIKAFIVYLIRF